VKKEEMRDGLYNSVIGYMRKEQAETLEKAYEFFWEEEYPEDFMSGPPLELGFLNFEDWLVCDYRSQDGTGAIDMYKGGNDVDSDSEDMLQAMKDSLISLFEVISSDGGLRLKDLVLGDKITFDANPLPQLSEGGVFAARLIEPGDGHLLGRCVYPFTKELSGNVTDAIMHNFKRYKKSKNPKGNLRQFLKDESYIFNTIWVSNLFRKT
jgi:hypothetical protein